MTAKEVKIMIDRVLGAVSVFPQGGTLRVILPKSAAKMLGTFPAGGNRNMVDEDEKPTFILLATNKGIILRSLKDYLEDDEMKLSNGQS